MELNIQFLVLMLVCKLTSGFPWQQDRPVCSSHNQLCDIAYEVKSGTGSQSFPSSVPMCRCPGPRSCPNGRRDSARVIYQEMTSPGTTINTKLSFCEEESIPLRVCKYGEVAITLRGFGPVITDVVGGVKCKCRKPMVLKKAYPDGMFSVRQYACGLKTCRVNSSDPPVCERVTPAKYGMGKTSEIPCQCPPDFYCNVNALGLSNPNRPVNLYCEPVPQW